MSKILEKFNQQTGIQWNPSTKFIAEVDRLEKRLKTNAIQPADDLLCIVIHTKLGLYDESYKQFINRLAAQKITFNTHEKRDVKRYIQWGEYEKLSKLATSKREDTGEIVNQTIESVREKVQRLDCHEELNSFLSANEKNKNDILESVFANYFNYHFDPAALTEAFNPNSNPKLRYFDYLRTVQPELFKRDQAAFLLELRTVPSERYADYRDWAISQIKEAYLRLNNHCYLFISIEGEDKGQLWELYGDLVLYAEKFMETNLSKTYFKPEKIQNDTISYIKELQYKSVDFTKAHTGYYYEDCFVLGEVDETYKKVLLSFVKNDSDETKIPCPACRSLNVRANSYPKLGVRSWECSNPVCPDRSLYGRGKRYSFYSILRQESINDVRNLISVSHINKWKFDITYGNANDAYQLIAEHYSLFEEQIIAIDGKGTKKPVSASGREVLFNKELTKVNTKYAEFEEGSFFQKYLVNKPSLRNIKPSNLTESAEVKVYCGDAYEVLSGLADNTIDGAVTSPPYYNARDYSTWNNMYSYLYDMYNIYSVLFHKLKPGALFVFNIFDYFDNERTIVYSDMGKKRVILGAYSLNMFKKIGFQVKENVIWDKGEIEGKRFFNQGNDFPYYQKPYNSWEHVFILQKPPTKDVSIKEILKEKPVLKMFGGKNILGHTAPYPKAIPNLLISNIQQGVVLDPFSGSMTTGRAAYEKGLNSINIELSKEYCDLGIKLWKQETDKISLLE